MLERLSPHKRNLALAILAALVVWFSWTVRSVLNPLILGYILANMLNPMVQGLERRGWSRRASANLIFLGFFLLATVVGVGVYFQGRALVRDVRSWDVQSMNLPPWAVDAWRGLEGDAQLEPSAAENPTMSDFLDTLQQSSLLQPEALLPYLRTFFGSLVAIATLLFLLPIYAYFLLFELDRIHGFVHRYVPTREKERFARIGTQTASVLAAFFRGRLLVCFLKGVGITAGLWIASLWLAGVEYVLLLGMGSGFLALVPFVGPLAAFVAAVLVLLANGTSVGLALGVMGAIFALAELVEGYVLLPRILGDSLGLHPVVVLASIFVGGAALGMFGFLIALPLTAVGVIVVRELVLPALADFADEADPGDGDGDAPKGKGKGRRKK